MKLLNWQKTSIKTVALILLTSGSLFSADKKEKWNEYRAQHFLIYYKNVQQDFIKTVEEQAENYFREISRNLGFYRFSTWTLDERAKIYIYDDQDDYVKSANQYKWSHGVTETRKKTIRTFPAAHGFFDTTLPHELTHIIFREYVGFRTNIPLWLDEGVAMNQERAKRWGAHKDVKTAMDEGRFIPLDQLPNVIFNSNTDKAIVNLFYAESASIVNYMISELGEFRFFNFCQNLERGQSLDNAIKLTYVRFENVYDLNRSWVKFLKDLD